jgi:hypothetical protein
MQNQLHLLYEADFSAWALQNVELIKQKRFTEVDMEHLAEELEDMGNNKKDQLDSRLEELMMHLLKWHYQPERRGSSWEISINKQRVAIERLLGKYPSLKYQLNERVENCYSYARRYAAIETTLPLATFPEQCPYSLQQLFDVEFIPTH